MNRRLILKGLTGACMLSLLPVVKAVPAMTAEFYMKMRSPWAKGDGPWTHYALVREGEIQTYYINGVRFGDTIRTTGIGEPAWDLLEEILDSPPHEPPIPQAVWIDRLEEIRVTNVARYG